MVYEGNEKYIFVSYSHADADRVVPALNAMAAEGFRLWYDSGIEAGTEWPEYIEDRLMHSEVVLVFMTPAAVESRNCRNEINFALELKKEILVIYLEDTTLLKGMRLQLNSSQSLFRKHHDSYESFIKELINARILQSCRDAASTPVASAPMASAPMTSAPTAPGRVEAQPAPKAEKKPGKLPAYALLGAILVALVVLICVIVFGGQDGGETLPSSEPATVTEPSQTEPLKMSDNLLDFTVELEGVVYQIPCRYEDLTSHGWTISSTGYSSDSLLLGGGSAEYTMSNNGKSITVSSYNPSGNAVALKDCLVAGLVCKAGDGVSVELAKGVTLDMTAEQIVEALGTPNSRDDREDYVELTYQDSMAAGGVQFTVYFAEEKQKNSEVLIMNLTGTDSVKTETNPEKPAYLLAYQTPAELGTEFKSPVAQIGGDLYCLPAPVSCFLDNGWTIVRQPSFVRAGNTDSIRLERDGARLDLNVVNGAEYQTLPENCLVTRVYAQADYGVEFKLPSGIQFGMKREQVVAAVTEEYSYYEGTVSHSWTYTDYKDLQLTIDIDVSVETQEVSNITLKCEYWEY